MQVEALYGIYLQHPSVETDSRKIKEGDLFFALKGENFNSNQFAAQALEQGAAYAIIDEKEYQHERTILVENVLYTLQQLARHHRQQFNIPVIAITGSNGKTTTKELIHTVLSSTYRTFTTEGNLNNHIGVPLTLLKIKQDAEMAVVEMGANHQQEIASYCKIAWPTHGLITNCGKAHLEGFGGVEGVRKGKGELFDHLREHGGAAFVMKDYDYLLEMSKGIAEVFTYGTRDADIVGVIGKSEPFLTVQFMDGISGTIATQLVGAYNLPNILAAVATGVYFEVPQDKIIAALENYSPSNSRSQLVKKGTNTIVLDAYNANPSSMQLAIENFAGMEVEDQNKVLVLGSMAELGAESQDEHKSIIRQINKYQWSDVILVGDEFSKTNHEYVQLNDASAAGEYLRQKKYQHHSFLVKGSRSMKMEKVLDYL